MPPHHPLPAVLAESRITPADAAALLDTTARTVVRWLAVGLPVAGAVVRLDGERVGRHWRTSREAVGRFLAAVRAARSPAPVVTPAARKRGLDKARRELAEMGVPG